MKKTLKFLRRGGKEITFELEDDGNLDFRSDGSNMGFYPEQTEELRRFLGPAVERRKTERRNRG